MRIKSRQEEREPMFRRTVLLIIAVAFLFSLPSIAVADGMDMKSISEKEVVKTDKDGKKHTEYVSTRAVKIVPGDMIRFTNIYRNMGEQPAESGLTINNPVPGNVAYIGGSAEGKDADITFSVDGGKSFHVPSELFVTGEDGKKRLARPDEYTDIKWVILRSILPGEEGSVAYKGRLK